MPDSSIASPVVLTIAGFDPSGGAGILADVRTIVALGCTPVAAVTSITMQNSESVSGAIHQTAEALRAQILPVVAEFRLAAVKIGMLPTRESVMEVVRLIKETDMPAPIVDPVLRSTSGYELMEPDAREVLLTELMPIARLITPNIPEAETLTGMRITSEDDMRKAARKLREMGARSVLIKGGHLKEKAEGRRQKAEKADLTLQAIDVLDDEGHVTVVRREWIDSPPVRGTGCMHSSAIAACLSNGLDLKTSVSGAQLFVSETIRNARQLGLIRDAGTR